MYLLTEEKIAEAKQTFRSLIIIDAKSGDDLFEKFGPGNIIEHTQRPFERFSDYESLLILLQKDDPQKYNKIHKGTPFYFLAWSALDMKNYEKALFYMDAAISEDIRNDSTGWINSVASSFLTLGQPNTQPAPRVALLLRKLVEEQITRFNNFSGYPFITVDSFIDRFVRTVVVATPRRSIITAFYTFLLEFEDRCVDLQLRSVIGGSIEPFLTHLFKGGLIFESLLKHVYPRNEQGQPVKTLSDIFKTTHFKDDFINGVDTSSSSLEDILNGIKNGSLQTAFNTTSRIRNTTGHNLVWSDVFGSIANYRLLFEQQINAILYIVSIKFP